MSETPMGETTWLSEEQNTWLEEQVKNVQQSLKESTQVAGKISKPKPNRSKNKANKKQAIIQQGK